MSNEAAPRIDELRPDGLTEAEAAKQRTLKAVVIGLGILILLAFAGVVAGMAYRASQIGKTPALGAMSRTPSTQGPAVSAAASTGLGTAQTLLPDVKVSLAPGSVVRSTSLQGSRLVMQHDGPAGHGVTIVDLATGQTVSKVTIEAPPAR
jgi:hypothetical protein